MSTSDDLWWRNIAIADDVIQQGSHDVDSLDTAGRTALHSAARQNDAKMAATLIQHGATVDKPDAIHGVTPLQECLREGAAATANVLLAIGGADPDAECAPTTTSISGHDFSVACESVEVSGSSILVVDRMLLSEFRPCQWFESKHAQRSLIVPNAGGHSVLSEALSIEYMHRKLGAELGTVQLEMEVQYSHSNCPILDFAFEAQGNTYGVSVTRAMKYGDPNAFSAEDAERLLAKKLTGMHVAGCAAMARFKRCFLHVFCQSRTALNHCRRVVKRILGEHDIIAKNVGVILTLADGENAQVIFAERKCHADAACRDVLTSVATDFTRAVQAAAIRLIAAPSG